MINGVLYQMLRSLLRVTTFYIDDVRQQRKTGAISRTTLVLEPANGGDLQEHAAERVVEQIKSRADKSAWSLAEIIEDVLPGFYASMANAPKNTRYRFVTEGRMGRWHDVYGFFATLKHREAPSHDVLNVLNDKDELQFGKRLSSLWSEREYTERSLFECIVDRLRQHPKPAAEPVEAVRQKLWVLLANFEFDGDQTAEAIQQEIDQHLLALVDSDTELAKTRDALLTDLLRRASQGNARINPGQFLADHNLDAVPLTDWPRLRDQAHDVLRSELSRRGYQDEDNVRADRHHDGLPNWCLASPILVLSGETGQGKSWELYGHASNSIRRGELAVLIDAAGEATKDLQLAAEILNHEIIDHDKVLPLNRIAARRRKLKYRGASEWLLLFVDGLQDAAEARKLAHVPWGDWGIRLALTCPPEIAPVIQEHAGSRCTIVQVSDFTVSELQVFLERNIGHDWPQIPSDVRDTLSRPLLAKLYCDVAQGSWHPTSEYELYAASWRRLVSGEHVALPLDAVGLKHLTLSLLEGAPYPWVAEQLDDAGLDNDAIRRLGRTGWLRSSQAGKYEIWHDRLLNWAVAEGLVAQAESGKLTPEELCRHVKLLYESGRVAAGRFLGYVPMDVVWLISREDSRLHDHLPDMLAALEDTKWPLPDALYRKLLPTIGLQVLPAMFERLRVAAAEQNHPFVNALVASVTSFDVAGLSELTAKLLDNESARVQRAAMKVLAKRPTSIALDRLWVTHCAIKTQQQGDARARVRQLALEEDSFEALKACVRLSPSWLEAKIHAVDANREPVESLAYLLANIDEAGKMWQRCKPVLFQKVPKSKERSLATNIWKHADKEETAWLRARVQRSDDLLGVWSLRALIRVDPDKAVSQLPAAPTLDLYLTRKFTFRELLNVRPQETLKQFHTMLESAPEPMVMARTFSGSENLLDPPTIDLLLDGLEELLIRTRDVEPSNHDLHLPLTILTKIHRLDLLKRFECRRGSRLEEELTSYTLRLGARPYVQRDSLERPLVLEVLFKIGGIGFTQVVNSWLTSGFDYGRCDGLRLAAKRPDAETANVLRQIVAREDTVKDFPHEQHLAAQALAAIGEWEPVIDFIMRWNHVPQGVWQARREHGPLSDELANRVAEQVEREPSPAAVLALSICGQKKYLEQVHELRTQFAGDHEVLHSCLRAMINLEDDSEAAEAFFVVQLTVPSDRQLAVNGLLRLGRQSALDALSSELRRRYDNHIVINLARRPSTRSMAAEATWKELQASKQDPWAQFNIEYLGCLRNADVEQFLRDRAFERDTRTLFVGQRDAAIRGLAESDPKSAFLAARHALADQDQRDRARYPYLLVDLAPDESIAVLLEQMTQEKTEAVRWAIGRALQETDITKTITNWLNDDDRARCIAACELAGWNSHCEGLHSRLTEIATGLDDDVATTAQAALDRIRTQENAEILIAEFRKEKGNTRKWVLLDSLIMTADPGETFRPWPAWVHDLAGHLSAPMRVYLVSQLKDQQRKLVDEARKQDSRAKAS